MTMITIGDKTVSAATGGRPIDDDDPLVILVHGAAMNRTVWSLQTRWLAHRGMSTLAVDLPGHGNSPDALLSSIDDYAQWLAELVISAQRPVHLVGHSMGSFVLLETPSRAPVASITLVGTASSMPVHPKLVEAAAANDPLAGQLMSGWAFAPNSRTGPHPSPGASMVGGTQAMINSAGAGVLHSDLMACADYDRADATASTIDVPCQLLLGQLDRMTPVAKASGFSAAIAGAVTKVVPGVGHMIQIEAPEVTRSAIADLVASIPSAVTS